MDYTAFEDTVAHKPLTLEQITLGLECLDGPLASTVARWGWTSTFVKAVALGREPPPPALDREIRDFVLPSMNGGDVRRVFALGHVKADTFARGWGLKNKAFRYMLDGVYPVPPVLATYIAQFWGFLDTWKPPLAGAPLLHAQHEPGSAAWVCDGLERAGITTEVLSRDWCYPQRQVSAITSGRAPLPPVLLGIVRQEVPGLAIEQSDIVRVLDALHVSLAGVASKDFNVSKRYLQKVAGRPWHVPPEIAAYLNRLAAFHEAHPVRVVRVVPPPAVSMEDTKAKEALIRKVKALRATMVDGEPMSHAKIGLKVGLSYERVRQLLLPGAPRTSRAVVDQPPVKKG